MRVVVTGGYGFLGKYVAEELRIRNHAPVVFSSKEYDLRDLNDTRAVIDGADMVIHCAARVGGIGLNMTHPGELFYENMLMGQNVIEAARLHGLKRVVVIGTACEYPHIVPIPTPESELWEGYPTFETASYAMAKKALLVMGCSYRDQYDLQVEHVIPSNLYGPHDHFDTVTGHAIPSIIAKFSQALARGDSEVPLWGTGMATRDFLHAADAARGIVDVAEKGTSDGFPINLGSGRETQIAQLAEMIGKFYRGVEPKFTGEVSDGVQRRLLSTARAWKDFNWSPSVRLEEGLMGTIAWYEDWDL